MRCSRNGTRINPKYIPSMHIFGRQIGAKLEKRKVGGHTYYYGKQFSDFGHKFKSKTV